MTDTNDIAGSKTGPLGGAGRTLSVKRPVVVGFHPNPNPITVHKSVSFPLKLRSTRLQSLPKKRAKQCTE